jgi:hypothetical protein
MNVAYMISLLKHGSHDQRTHAHSCQRTLQRTLRAASANIAKHLQALALFGHRVHVVLKALTQREPGR